MHLNNICQQRKTDGYIEEVVIGREEKAVIPAQIKHKKCKALIDTGPSRSCISEKNYHEMQLPPLAEIFAIKVTSATGFSHKSIGNYQMPCYIRK